MKLNADSNSSLKASLEDLCVSFKHFGYGNLLNGTVKSIASDLNHKIRVNKKKILQLMYQISRVYVCSKNRIIHFGLLFERIEKNLWSTFTG